jgi:RimJ/RimL family protein N-acetyltransferase/isopentenyldiphosphate isomerase
MGVANEPPSSVTCGATFSRCGRRRIERRESRQNRVLIGELTNIRAIEFEDTPVVYRWLNDPAVMAGWGDDAAVVSRAVVGRRVGAWIDAEEKLGRPVAFIIEDLERRAIGLIVGDPSDDEGRKLRLSLLIGSPDDWGQGFGRDALDTWLDAAFESWNVRRVWLEVEEGNDRAERLYRSAGFRHEATLRKARFRNGNRFDVLRLAMNATDRTTDAMPENSSKAQDLMEPFDVLTSAGEPTGVSKPRWQVHRDGDWHRAIHLWIFGIDGSGAYLDFQRRGMEKDTWPGFLDATVAGHIRAGETMVDALRESDEEVGIQVAVDEVIQTGARYSVNEGTPGRIDHEIQDLLLLRRDRPLGEYRPNPDEVDAIVRLRLDDAIALLSAGVPRATGQLLRSGNDVIEPIDVESGQFIPSLDRYFLRVAVAARRALAGDTPIVV